MSLIWWPLLLLIVTLSPPMGYLHPDGHFDLCTCNKFRVWNFEYNIELNHSILYLVILSKSPTESVLVIGSTLSSLCKDVRLLQYNKRTLEESIWWAWQFWFVANPTGQMSMMNVNIPESFLSQSHSMTRPNPPWSLLLMEIVVNITNDRLHLVNFRTQQFPANHK